MAERSVVKRLKSPDDWVDSQVSTLRSVGEKEYKKGIKSPKKNPITAGIAAEGKYADSMKKVIDEERRAKGLEGTTMAEWFAYSDEFADRLVPGVTKREAKVRKFVTKFQPMLMAHVESIDELDDETDADRETRMLENLRGLKALHGKWRGA